MDRPNVTPPFAYYGGKTTLGPQIAAFLPPHQHYIEPFAGSLAVLFAKSPSKWETVNDIDGDLMTFWRILRDQPEDLARLSMLTPHARDEYELSQDLDGAPDDLERARRVWVRLSQSRTNSLRPRGGWRYREDPAKGSSSMPSALDGYVARMELVSQRLHRVTLENRDALDVIAEYGRHESVCIYADPPYLGATRAVGYRHEMTTADQHDALATVLRECKATVVLSGYDSPLYSELFDGWHRADIKAPTALTGETGRVEVLWSNRPLGEPDLFADFGEVTA